MSVPSTQDSSGGLRRRSADSKDTTGRDGTYTSGELVTSEKSTSRKAEDRISHQPNSAATANRLVPLIFIIICSFGLSLLLRGRFSALPKTYALCSKQGNIYTVDASTPRAECIVVHESRILSVGTLGMLAEKFKAFKSGLKFYFVEPGHIVVPGLADSHAHLLEQGFKMELDKLSQYNCTKTCSEVIEKVKNYVKNRPDLLKDRGLWIQGDGWDQTKWPEREFPTAAEFEADPLLRGRPIRLLRVDYHAVWVSQKVIDEAGNLPQDVQGGLIVRDENGSPTGIFVDNAMDIIKVPEWTEKQMLDYYFSAVKEALSYGLTSIHDAWALPRTIEFFKRVADANKLPLRLYLMRAINLLDYRGEQIERFVNYGPAGRLTLRSIKMMSDGSLGSWSAALMEPYTDKPETRGLLLASPERLSDVITDFWNSGFQTNIHCIGDLANNVVLDIFEKLLRDNSSAAEHRPRIEHAQIMTPSDLERTARLGVIASVQPTHATTDMWYAESRLGPERIKSAYAYRTLLQNSEAHVLPLGSDFPVESVNPLLGFYAAVTRLSESGDSPHGTDGWFPSERLTRSEALKGMTLDAAYASFNEDQIGSLSPGKHADFVVLDTNIMTVPFPQILRAKVMATVVDGRPVYGKL
ncbi:uncharacterized protein FOMMEDRAFT_105127 [Fomitiporia mediterranea MF3/22]|uniref:uncharacterized protein n=1 Tax=Fomitiporia mediterranea (strain MF3/22) TaxID=694068 RepID=UPI00044096E6|nr:uncharacterized protein FOMMEDRAFT_105127 [Fomitiporia mediterranea MF3/22]EJD04927.1 hypothetical protein FOMMEDRAFT_105127 [Fomitiporia mediterranea MF3/22]